jgi:hypothetical protein
METLVTSDIYMVAALLSYGYEIQLPLNTSDPRHFRFTIIGTGIEEIKQKWVNGVLEGNLTEYSRCIKNMKLLIHDRGE